MKSSTSTKSLSPPGKGDSARPGVSGERGSARWQGGSGEFRGFGNCHRHSLLAERKQATDTDGLDRTSCSVSRVLPAGNQLIIRSPDASRMR